MIEQILRKLPPFKGKLRIARMLLKGKLQEIKDIIIRGGYGCSFKVPNVIESIGFNIYVNGFYEKETIDFIISRIPSGGVLIDIGANIGSISLPVCKVRKDIRAICIEASPRVYEYLDFNVSLNKINNCELVNKAVTNNNDGLVNFFSPLEKFGKGSLSSVYTTDAEQVETVMLDSLLKTNNTKPPDFIKVDIEGYEYYAFAGAKKLLAQPAAPDILFEFVDWAEEAAHAAKGDAQKLLLNSGYKLFLINEKNELSLLAQPMTNGAAMIFATKK